jgi:hypothetical protein
MRLVGNIRVGNPDTTPSMPSHTRGVRQGNKPGSFERTPGLYKTGEKAGGHRLMGKGTARRSTGINPKARNPIDPSSPNLSPA